MTAAQRSRRRVLARTRWWAGPEREGRLGRPGGSPEGQPSAGAAETTRIAGSALVLGLLGLAGLGAAVSLGPVSLDAADAALAELRGRGGAAGVLDLLDRAGTLPIWFALVLAMAVAAAARSQRLAAQIVVASLAAELASAVLKVVVGRARPEGAAVDDLLITAGFPSGHVTRTAVVVAALLVLAPWGSVPRRMIAVAGLVLVGAMGVARVSSRAHHTSDVLAGALLGAAIVAGWSLYRSRFVA